MTKRNDDHPETSADDLPDGSGSDGSKPAEGEDTASGGGADDE